MLLGAKSSEKACCLAVPLTVHIKPRRFLPPFPVPPKLLVLPSRAQGTIELPWLVKLGLCGQVRQLDRNGHGKGLLTRTEAIAWLSITSTIPAR